MPASADPLLDFLRFAANGPPGDCLIVVPTRRVVRVDAIEQIVTLLHPDCVTYRPGQSLTIFGRRAHLVGANEYERLRGMRATAVLIADRACDTSSLRFLEALDWCKTPGAPTFHA